MEDLRIAIVAITSLLLVLSSFSVAVRLCRSYFVAGTLRLHDLLIFVALIGIVMMGCITTVMTTMGLGQSEHDLERSRKQAFQQALLTANLCYFAADMFVKLGLLMTYLRFTLKPIFHHSIHALQIVVVAFTIGCVFAALSQCVPFTALWDASVPSVCINGPAFFVGTATITVIVDICVYLMPIIFTWNLQTTRSNKTWVRVLFGLGSLVVVASIIRLYLMRSIMNDHRNLSYNWAKILLASAVETHLAIIVACAPAIKSLVSRSVLPHMREALISGAAKMSKLRSRPSSTRTSSTSSIEKVATPSYPAGYAFGPSSVITRPQPLWRKLSHRLPIKRGTLITTVYRDAEIEDLDLHANMPNPLPTIHTLDAFVEPTHSSDGSDTEYDSDMQVDEFESPIFFDDMLPGIGPVDTGMDLTGTLSNRSSAVLSEFDIEMAMPPPAIVMADMYEDLGARLQTWTD